jgi:hypothetical protein
MPSQLFKRSTTRIIRKAESKIPSYFQLYADFYREYMHAVDDYFAIYYLVEHKLFENKTAGRKARMQKLDELVWNTTNVTISQIETATNLHNLFTQTQISWIRAIDKCLHLMLDYYKTTNLQSPSK